MINVRNCEFSMLIILKRRATALTIEGVAKAIVKVLDPKNLFPAPHVVLCWDESHCLVEPVRNAKWSRFSQLCRALRTLLGVSFVSVFVSTAGKFHYFSPSPAFDKSSRLQHGTHRMPPPITEVGFDQFAEKVDAVQEWSLDRLASTHHIAHLGRAL
jgi:hypothetical protein